MNEVDRQVAELQAQVGNKAKQEYFVEVESEDIASVLKKRNLKKIPKINIVSLFRKDLMNMLINLVNLDDVKRKQYKLLKLLRPKETKFKKN
jgi:hypothetical protein